MPAPSHEAVATRPTRPCQSAGMFPTASARLSFRAQDATPSAPSSAQPRSRRSGGSAPRPSPRACRIAVAATCTPRRPCGRPPRDSRPRPPARRADISAGRSSPTATSGLASTPPSRGRTRRIEAPRRRRASLLLDAYHARPVPSSRLPARTPPRRADARRTRPNPLADLPPRAAPLVPPPGARPRRRLPPFTDPYRRPVMWSLPTYGPLRPARPRPPFRRLPVGAALAAGPTRRRRIETCRRARTATSVSPRPASGRHHGPHTALPDCGDPLHGWWSGVAA